METQPTSMTKTFELKGSMFTLTVMHLFDTDMEKFSFQIKHHVAQTPKFFNNMPLVIDLKKVSEPNIELDFSIITGILRQHHIIPVGIRHGNDTQNKAAQAASLAILSGESNERKVVKQNPKPSTPVITETAKAQNLVISQPVRSGQQVYARNGNLIVLSSVSHGAELLADGHIHVYGSLKGKALAGILGDKTARIFCHKLEAELVSIAGLYKLRDDLPDNLEDANFVQVFMENEKIETAPILT